MLLHVLERQYHSLACRALGSLEDGGGKATDSRTKGKSPLCPPRAVMPEGQRRCNMLGTGSWLTLFSTSWFPENVSFSEALQNEIHTCVLVRVRGELKTFLQKLRKPKNTKTSQPPVMSPSQLPAVSEGRRRLMCRGCCDPICGGKRRPLGRDGVRTHRM